MARACASAQGASCESLKHGFLWCQPVDFMGNCKGKMSSCGGMNNGHLKCSQSCVKLTAMTQTPRKLPNAFTEHQSALNTVQ